MRNQKQFDKIVKYVHAYKCDYSFNYKKDDNNMFIHKREENVLIFRL